MTTAEMTPLDATPAAQTDVSLNYDAGAADASLAAESDAPLSPWSSCDDDEELIIGDFVSDAEPSAYLRCTMSRRIAESLVARERLGPYLVELLGLQDADWATQRAAIRGLHYGKSARRVILIHCGTSAQAAAIREQLHEKPCALIHQRVMYVEFALPRKEKEARDSFLRVANISRRRAMEDPSARIPGLVILPEFVTREQEAALLGAFDADDGARWLRTVKARQVQHYGFAFNYDTRRCDSSAPLPADMPAPLEPLMDALATTAMGDRPDQVTVNEYLPGQGIAAHIDTHSAFTPAIASLSLGHEIVMEFRHPDGVRCESVLLQPRSLLIMTGASRYEWTHAIPPRAFDVIDGQRVDRQRRVSVTFRKIQDTPCRCAFPVQCDAQRQEQERLQAKHGHATAQSSADGTTGDNAPDQDREDESASASLAPTPVEQQFVHEFYETVAQHFSSTRYNAWPRIAAFVRALEPGSWVADLGCGNGKYMKCVDPTQSLIVGGDRSSRLVEICHARGLNAMVCDAMCAPIRSQCCDAALSIAVLHHLSTRHHRLAAVREVVRVLRVGGRGVIYAWAHEQQRSSRRQFDPDRQDFMVPWNLDKRFAQTQTQTQATSDESETQESQDSATAPVVVQRYCHMFKQGELEELVRDAGDAEVEQSYYDQSNWAVVLRRVR
ncbi:hypothetical protein PINS_up005024 [Pythium insidiosum]|nr:hypothetical protein PINS_up005024 [Pythium insidiosum]